MGAGHWAPTLEQRLVGLHEGAETEFELAARDAYGEHNPDLLCTLTRGQLAEFCEPGTEFTVGETVQLRAVGGVPARGTLARYDEAGAVVDFNHPLAGRPLRVRVRIVGVL